MAQGVVPPTIDQGKQEKHIPGTNNFIPGRSEVTHSNPQALVDQFAGTGQRSGQREHVDTGQVVGVHVAQDGTRTTTTRMTIHYAQNGTVHIVPARATPPPNPGNPTTP
jgi:filamentous hemagglutinin